LLTHKVLRAAGLSMVAQFLLAVPFMSWQKKSEHVSMRSAAVVIFSVYISVCLWCLACSDIIYIQLALMSIKSILLALPLGSDILATVENGLVSMPSP